MESLVPKAGRPSRGASSLGIFTFPRFALFFFCVFLFKHALFSSVRSAYSTRPRGVFRFRDGLAWAGTPPPLHISSAGHLAKKSMSITPILRSLCRQKHFSSRPAAIVNCNERFFFYCTKQSGSAWIETPRERMKRQRQKSKKQPDITPPPFRRK